MTRPNLASFVEVLDWGVHLRGSNKVAMISIDVEILVCRIQSTFWNVAMVVRMILVTTEAGSPSTTLTIDEKRRIFFVLRIGLSHRCCTSGLIVDDTSVQLLDEIERIHWRMCKIVGNGRRPLQAQMIFSQTVHRIVRSRIDASWMVSNFVQCAKAFERWQVRQISCNYSCNTDVLSFHQIKIFPFGAFSNSQCKFTQKKKKNRTWSRYLDSHQSWFVSERRALSGHLGCIVHLLRQFNASAPVMKEIMSLWFVRYLWVGGLHADPSITNRKFYRSCGGNYCYCCCGCWTRITRRWLLFERAAEFAPWDNTRNSKAENREIHGIEWMKLRLWGMTFCIWTIQITSGSA